MNKVIEKLKPIPPLTSKDIHRFWGKVNIVENNDACWEWLSGKSRGGYGSFSVNHSISVIASRVAYYLYYKADPRDRFVCHKCDNPSCCNPNHLFLGTSQDNVDDREKKGRGNSKIGEWRERNIENYYGEGHNKSKLTNTQVIEIRETYVFRKTRHIDLAKKYGVSVDTILRVINGKNWKHISTPNKSNAIINIETGKVYKTIVDAHKDAIGISYASLKQQLNCKRPHKTNFRRLKDLNNG